MPRSTTRTPSAEDFLPLSSDTALILLVLSSGAVHGYGIIRAVSERSDGEIVLQTGALYRQLKHLLSDQLIEETDAPSSTASSDERRRYYTMTPLGRNVLDAEVQRMAKLVRAAKTIHAGRKPRFA